MEYLFYISLGWFIVEFEPFQSLAIYLNEKIGRKAWFEYFMEFVTCWKCATFWSVLAVTWSFEKAVFSSFLAFIAELIIEAWSRRR
jgi:hypothetical protein